jgi:hypothetical protein
MRPIKYTYGKNLDCMVHRCYTINNKRKQAEGRDYTKLETYPALLYLIINNKKLWPRV